MKYLIFINTASMTEVQVTITSTPFNMQELAMPSTANMIGEVRARSRMNALAKASKGLGVPKEVLIAVELEEHILPK